MTFLVAALILTNLIQSAEANVSKRFLNSDPSVSLSRFLDYPGGASHDNFKPNPKFWGRGIDFSCASPWNSGGGRLRAGTLISKRHIVFAKHFPLWSGVRILFVDDEGQVCPLRIESTKGIDKTDIMVGLLNYEVTPNIRPAKILPPDADKYIGMGTGMPVLTLTQWEKLSISEISYIPTNGSRNCTIYSRAPADKSREVFAEGLIIGDSGNPAFILINGEPVLLYCLYGGGRGSGSALHLYSREIQKAMDELCLGYVLEVFDFSQVKNEK